MKPASFESWIKAHTPKPSEPVATCFGVPVDSLTRVELLAIVNYLVKEQDRQMIESIHRVSRAIRAI
jgi:hypothetical protein